MNSYDEIKDKLIEKGLKVTTQRVTILDIIFKLRNHPTADDIFNEIKKDYPSISLATVYNTLNAFVEKGLLNIVETESGTARFDHVMNKHNHIFCEDTGEINDYYDDELNEMVENHLRKKGVPNFIIKDIKLFIVGNYCKTK